MASNITRLVVLCQVVRGIIIRNILEGEKICPRTVSLVIEEVIYFAAS